MFQKIARINVEDGWSVEIGYEIPNVITGDTKLDIATKIVNEDPKAEIDLESTQYKQLDSVAEVLKIGFNIGCSYTTKVMEQAAAMANKVMSEEDPGKVTGETSELIVE